MDDGFPNFSVKKGIMADTTSGSIEVVAALSK
jgi:hypothetical protein